MLTANRDGAAQVAELSSKVATLSGELESLKQVSTADRQKGLIEAAINSGRLPPALRNTAEAFFSEHGQKAGEAYLNGLPEHPAGRIPALPTPAPAGGGTTEVSQEMLMNAKRLGISPDALKLAAQQDAEARARSGQARTTTVTPAAQ
jgi:phage I-like protein